MLNVRRTLLSDTETPSDCQKMMYLTLNHNIRISRYDLETESPVVGHGLVQFIYTTKD
jgi:hypothetical protein